MPDHIGIDATDAATAIIMGDPQRLPLVAEHFASLEMLTDRHGYIIARVEHEARPILLVVTGIGGPSVAIAVEELIEIGISQIIRLGTCGAIQPHIRVTDLVISTGAVRHEGTSQQYLDQGYPAIPDHEVLCALHRFAAQQSHPFHLGITHCKDAYYLEKPDKQVSKGATRRYWKQLRESGVLATEMELAVLFVLGQIRQIQTGGILINVGKVTLEPAFHRALAAAVGILKQVIPTLNVPVLPRRDTPGHSYLVTRKGQ